MFLCMFCVVITKFSLVSPLFGQFIYVLCNSLISACCGFCILRELMLIFPIIGKFCRIFLNRTFHPFLLGFKHILFFFWCLICAVAIFPLFHSFCVFFFIFLFFCFALSRLFKWLIFEFSDFFSALLSLAVKSFCWIFAGIVAQSGGFPVLFTYHWVMCVF